ncbi:MAG: tRNA (guanosine(37)-N1)-methyltransferase TrmD [Clostridiaceae bacterium]|jgi:tRNA (guanine37-N1)-methyltransferase|nr:tRNA (guanosine(37)-N1)-methyltransferase TrmD [Clostridiaceae bacterium]
MKFTVLTLFPELLETYVKSSILGRALDRELFQFKTIQIRDFAINDYGQVDDSLYGGGVGMLMMCEPVYQAWQQARAGDSGARTLVMKAGGRSFDQKMAEELAEEDHLILLCGHYEGIDARVLEEIGAEPVSVGDFVLTGGELPACLIIDATVRLLDGVLVSEEAWQDESFSSGLLSERQYTRPENWRDHQVPSVLLSGHDARIKRHRVNDSLWQTIQMRPDLLDHMELSYEQINDLLLWLEEELN